MKLGEREEEGSTRLETEVRIAFISALVKCRLIEGMTRN